MPVEGGDDFDIVHHRLEEKERQLEVSGGQDVTHDRALAKHRPLVAPYQRNTVQPELARDIGHR